MATTSYTNLKLYRILLLVISVGCYTFSRASEEASQYNDCSTNFTTLERALFETGNNRFNLISAFLPDTEGASLFVNVRYNFSTPDDNKTDICENWIWTTGTFYLIQSPDVFQFTSLLFVYPETRVHNVTLMLPAECADLADQCTREHNTIEAKMLELLTRRLKLYSQYNSLENVAVLSDENAYAVKAVPVQNIDKIYYKSLDTYFSFVIIFPLTIMVMFNVVCFKGVRLQLRVKLSNPKYSSSFAALVTVGMLFSLFVVALDACALIWAFDPHIGEQHHVLQQSGLNSTVESHNVAWGTLVVDGGATVLSCIVFAFGLLLEYKLFCREKEIDKCLNCGFNVLLCPIFCGAKLDTSDIKQSREKMNWILATTCIAPITCFGSHIGFVVLAWLADPKHAGAVSVIYMFMFFFYYVTLKAFYQLLIDGKTSCLTCCGNKDVPKDCCCSCCCSCLLHFNNQHETLYELTSPLESPQKEVEAHEKYLLSSHISFWAIFMTCIFGVALAVVQIYAIASLVQLPLLGVIEDTPNYILSLFQVAVFFLTAVITYTILTAEEPVERDFLKNVVRNFDYYFQKFKAQNRVPPPSAGEPHLTPQSPPLAGGPHPTPQSPQQAGGPHPTPQSPLSAGGPHPTPQSPQQAGGPHPTPQSPLSAGGPHPTPQSPQQAGGPHPTPQSPLSAGGPHPTPQSPQQAGVLPPTTNGQSVTETTPLLPRRQQTSTETATHKPPRSNEVQKLGNIVGALVYKHLNEHIVIEMGGSTSEDDLL